MSRSARGFAFEVIAGARHFKVSPASGMSADLDEPYIEMEALWAPDSSAFSLAWNETAITDRSEIYVLEAQGPRQVDLTPVREGFARKFPPCVGDPGPCAVDHNGRGYNYLTVAWAAPHTVVLMAGVPPSSSWGRDMGRVSGYEIDAITGRIMRVLTPVEFKKRWQSHLGWDFSVNAAE